MEFFIIYFIGMIISVGLDCLYIYFNSSQVRESIEKYSDWYFVEFIFIILLWPIGLGVLLYRAIKLLINYVINCGEYK